MAHFAEAPDEAGKHLKIRFDHGTTTLGFQYQGGIILAVDSRATGGQFIGKFIILNIFVLYYIFFLMLKKFIILLS